jgi:putative transposase
MPRHARTVFSGMPHHVVQRGNHRAQVFFSPGDCETYLRLLREHATRHEVDIVAYCLMSNHVHLVVIPPNASALHRSLKSVHGHYAQRVNRIREMKGHLWQGRYFSSPLDSDYFRNAVRYVELNPLRAGLVSKPEDYAWSSAAARCGLRRDPILMATPGSRLPSTSDWSSWLAEGVGDEACAALRSNGRRNLPCGSEAFIDELERIAGKPLRHKQAGRRTASSKSDKRQRSLLLEKSGNVPS